MTEQAAALRCLADSETTARAVALSEFETQHTADSLVMDTWFSIQASSSLPSTLDEVKRLEAHPQFSLQNPNKARALIAAFARNAALFHAKVWHGTLSANLFSPHQYITSLPLSPFPSRLPLSLSIGLYFMDFLLTCTISMAHNDEGWVWLYLRWRQGPRA